MAAQNCILCCILDRARPAEQLTRSGATQIVVSQLKVRQKANRQQPTTTNGKKCNKFLEFRNGTNKF